MDASRAALSSDHGEDRDLLLRDAVERARASAFYAEHLRDHRVADRGDLKGLPLTEKRHLREAGPFGMLAVPPAKAWHYHESSGTTGEPISTWCGLAELRRMAEIVRRLTPELADDTILLNRFPLFAPVAFVFEEALRLAGGCHIPAGNMTWDVPFDRAIDFIRRLGATALASLPLEPILLFELARELRLDPARDLATLEVIFLGGAVLPPALRRRIEQDWGARVVEIYGSNETMLMGVGCKRGRLHLCEELLELEVLDPRSNAPVAPGEIGVLTVTSLVHQVMPLVRYSTGDLVRLDREPCPCGRPGPTAQVLGRAEETIRYGERSAFAYDVVDAAYEIAERLGTRIFFAVLLHRHLHLLLEVDNPTNANAAHRDTALGRELSARLGLPVTVEYLPIGEVLDRSALLRTPRIYKPSVLADWRMASRRPVTIMEAILEWPRFDVRTLGHLVRRGIRAARRRRRLWRQDQFGGE
jgi:phenylacetate-CoA ligase